MPKRQVGADAMPTKTVKSSRASQAATSLDPVPALRLGEHQVVPGGGGGAILPQQQTIKKQVTYGCQRYVHLQLKTWSLFHLNGQHARASYHFSSVGLGH